MVQYMTNENTNLFIIYSTTMKVQYLQGVTSLDSLGMQMKRRKKTVSMLKVTNFLDCQWSLLLAKTNRVGKIQLRQAKFREYMQCFACIPSPPSLACAHGFCLLICLSLSNR